MAEKVLWDRKTDGGFPETKELKRRVRDIIEPERNLGHVDRDYPKGGGKTTEEKPSGDDKPVVKQKDDAKKGADGVECEDCKTDG